MRARNLLLSPVVASFALSGWLGAQVPVRVTPARILEALPAELSPEVAERLAAQQAQGGGEAAVDGKAAQAANKRLQAFKQLQFDRRPSAMLAAWAAPELKPYDPSEERQGAGGGDAAAQPVAGADAASQAGVESLLPGEGGAVLSTDELQRLIDQAGELAADEAEAPAAAAGAAASTSNAAGAPAKPLTEAQIEQKKLQREMEMLQRDVTLGRWHAVGDFFATLPEKERQAAYEHFLTVLPRHPTKPQQRVPPNLQEKNRFSFEEAFVLADLAPGGFDKQQCKLIAPIVKRALDDGSVMEELLRLLEVEVSKADEQRRLDRREAAVLLSELKFDAELGPFLPTADEAEQSNDREALNLLARHALAKYAAEQRREWLGVAWQVTQAVLAKGEVEEQEKEEALRRAVELAPKVQQDLGPAWLAESFTSRPERGMEIIATIGGQVATGFAEKARDADYRADGLKLQKTAVEALLESAPELAEKWRPALGLLAAGWIVEADYSRQFSKTVSYGPVMERDAFGNIFYSNQRRGGGGNIAAVEPDDLMAAQPSGRWADLLSDELRPHFTTVSAQLWLKVNEHKKAFPYIEQLAVTNPRKAKELAHEFLRVWMRNNNPNTSSRTSSYMFSFGFSQRANGIPLTRSKQQRNLEDLANYVDRLRALPIDGLDESLLGDAFIAAHSSAEVYRLETIERVFGDVDELSPMLLGHLLGVMRTNLASIWRTPAVQEQEKTGRSQQQMLAEVARGYDVALEIAESARDNSGGHWMLQAAVASILHDKNNFAKDQKRTSDFAENRMAAFEMFREAADSYAMIADTLALDEESALPYTIWFYATLGACDLGGIDEETVVAKSQLPLIKAALADLPDGSRERHQGMFANLLFTRMSGVRPQIKYRYLQAGFEIVGDDPRAEEAKKIWDYYQDLVRELKLEAVVDGDTAVGTEPFGVRVDIVHSQEIERESNGFQKYATNQNNQRAPYNYGRPLENYRDKFHDGVIASLQENFEILSVTFNSENMESVRDEDPEWRRTPYAYLLLQARGPQIDRIPSMQLDFDFLDTSGFMILPVGTSPVAIDASAAPGVRPFGEIQVNQLLDERKLDEGKVTLEIKAKCTGLVPDLDEFLALETPGFRVAKRDDQGAAVMRFADDGERVESERVWLLSLEPEGEGRQPGNFRFAAPIRDGVTAVYQRYDDADLETVDAEVALRRRLVADAPWWAWLLLGLAVVGYLLWFFFAPSGHATVEERDNVLRMPQHVTPFTVLALLQAIAGRRDFGDAQRAELEGDIRRIEAAHFGRGDASDLDLEKIAQGWLRRAS